MQCLRMSLQMKPTLFILTLVNLAEGIVYKDFCATRKNALECTVLRNRDSLPKNENCNPFGSGCELNDLIDERIASCQLELKNTVASTKTFARCYPKISTFTNVYMNRVVSNSDGDPACIPRKYKRKLICGDRGTRCVCDTGPSESKPRDRLHQHKCRCQWFIDYCSIENACTDNSTCLSTGSQLSCGAQGSVNQCTIDPSLCEDKQSYCVELMDNKPKWNTGSQIEGDGFACIDKAAFTKIGKIAPYCNFNVTDRVFYGEGFRTPGYGMDYCCYIYLVCVGKNQEIGGYLFKHRPCFCNHEFRKCLIDITGNTAFIAEQLLHVLNLITTCTLDDSGKCNPKNPNSCNKGDLIDNDIAMCKINCKSGPLLPIEKRSCRVRQCIPPNNLPHLRVIDVPYYKESSRCDAVTDGLPVHCGSDNTRCVCDGQPTAGVFTDGCRCQYWPPF